MVVVVDSVDVDSGAADEPIGPVAVELIGVMPLTTAARWSEKYAVGEILPVRCRLGVDRRIPVAPMHFLALLTGLARQSKPT